MGLVRERKQSSLIARGDLRRSPFLLVISAEFLVLHLQPLALEMRIGSVLLGSLSKSEIRGVQAVGTGKRQIG